MKEIVKFAVKNSRFTLIMFMFFLVYGFSKYQTIPKEGSPDVQIPIVYVSVIYAGISPEDSEQLILKPLEIGLKSIKGVKKITTNGYENGGNAVLEFDSKTDIKKALDEVRNKMSDIRGTLPNNLTQEPTVSEVNMSLFPILNISISGPYDEKIMSRYAKDLSQELEKINEILSIDIRGDNSRVVKLVLTENKISTLPFGVNALSQIIAQNNQLLGLGTLENLSGKYSLKIPTIIKSIDDIENIAVVSSGNSQFLLLKDLVDIRDTFVIPNNLARFDGNRSLTLSIAKRQNENLIHTVDKAIATTHSVTQNWPKDIQVSITNDASIQVRDLVKELQNSVILACLLVFVVMYFSLGWFPTLLIGSAIPLSFFMAFCLFSVFGYTINMVVLFALILAVGMMVDDAIIVTEYADRRMMEGLNRKEAYTLAAQKMAGPVIAATLTRIAAFLPLLMWPGIPGQFMKYLPITMIFTLSSSLLVALVFTPTVGALFGRVAKESPPPSDNGWFMKTIYFALNRPFRVFFLAVALLLLVPVIFGFKGKGVIFFPSIEPEEGVVLVRARGNLSIYEMDALVKPVEAIVREVEGIKHVVTRVGGPGTRSSAANDSIGQISFVLEEWDQRKPATAIIESIRERTKDIAGVIVEVKAKEGGGPSQGKPIQLSLSSSDSDLLNDHVVKLFDFMAKDGRFVDFSSDQSLPGIELKISLKKESVNQYGTSPIEIGNFIKLITGGYKVTQFRPSDSNDPIDVILVLDDNFKTLAALNNMKIKTSKGLVPLSNLITIEPKPRVSTIIRKDSQRTITIVSDLLPRYEGKRVQPVAMEKVIADAISQDSTWNPKVNWKFGGESEDREETSSFLKGAFGLAIFLIFAILLIMFNNFISVFMILFSIILSTVGVLLGLLIMGIPFSIIMTGLGIVALAGIVTNNNIVLIETYQVYKEEGLNTYTAAAEASRHRVRPVMLTAITAVLGVLPSMLQVSVDFFNLDITVGHPSSQFWVHLSNAIAFGLTFATILTLVVTPSMLVIIDRMANWRKRGDWKRWSYWQGRLFAFVGSLYGLVTLRFIRSK